MILSPVSFYGVAVMRFLMLRPNVFKNLTTLAKHLVRAAEGSLTATR